MNDDVDSGSPQQDEPVPDPWEAIRKKIFQLKKTSIKPYTLKELAGIYEVCIPTFRLMLNPLRGKLGWRIGRYYGIKEVRQIFRYIDHLSPYYKKLNLFLPFYSAS